MPRRPGFESRRRNMVPFCWARDLFASRLANLRLGAPAGFAFPWLQQPLDVAAVQRFLSAKTPLVLVLCLLGVAGLTIAQPDGRWKDDAYSNELIGPAKGLSAEYVFACGSGNNWSAAHSKRSSHVGGRRRRHVLHEKGLCGGSKNLLSPPLRF
jgi:hypothetical protein